MTEVDESELAPARSSLIRGRYESVGLLGRGGQGEVVRAIDRRHDREVALKIRPVFDEGARQLLKETGDPVLSLGTVVARLQHAADSASHLHAQRVVQGDIRPANIVLTRD